MVESEQPALFELPPPPRTPYRVPPSPCAVCGEPAHVDVTAFAWNAHNANINGQPDKSYRACTTRAEGFACLAHLDQVTDRARETARGCSHAYLIRWTQVYPYTVPGTDMAWRDVEQIDP